MRLLIPIVILVLAGCATTPSPAGSGANWIPTCRAVGCAESAAGMYAPDGATLSFRQCIDGVERTYGYRREQGAWIMTSLAATASSCQGSSE
jgi:hypothetical protein